MPLRAEFDTLGGPEHIKLVERPVPPPETGEVQIRMRAAGLNRAELLYVAGQYLFEPVLPGAPLGVEGAGEIVGLGPGVENFAVGDRVAILPMMDWLRYGVLGEVVNMPADVLEPIPDGVSFETAAAFWMAYATAFGMIVQAGQLPKDARGTTVVVTGASSSVGTAALQILRDLGATSIATTRTKDKVTALKDAGADHVVVTGAEALDTRVADITGGSGADLVCDSVVGDLVGPASAALAPEGRLVLMGIQSGEVPELPFYPLLTKGITVTGFHLVWHLLDHPERRKQAVSYLMPRLAAGAFAPIVDRVFDFQDVTPAYAHMSSNAQVGKIVVTF